ncbi:putative receptor-activated ca2+-permeable cation channel protein [Botrytis fragariae]|uniref:Putative receptor-activated ca2+-permeable cation channel protein n=1 Tax=Botrytis fragariae TaxID=1964551 RepID=A0A8H6EHV9_9HELO|nr:putative receptor-activated ca2+-permeable cation channel protein [Botrytis fragariae]KAF5872776.1 putative receptor-activated ca2+-permeable cation channel protein [Botrytis fragariae]
MESTESPYEGQKLVKLPTIVHDDPFVKVVKTLSIYFVDEIVLPSTFEQLRTTSAGNKIRILVEHLVENVTNPAIINAILTLKWHFSTLDVDDRGINETRASACEIVAWRFLSRVSERDAVDFCLYELPSPTLQRSTDGAAEEPEETQATEHSTLLPQFRGRNSPPGTRPPSQNKKTELLRSISHMGSFFTHDDMDDDEDDPTSSFTGLNALEISVVADCKKFLSQRIVQKIITGIWKGDITFWESLSEHTQKKAQFYNRKKSDPFSRLRVPRYIKAFEVLFFASFLFLYYAVLVERNPYYITPLEIVLYVWFAAFAYDELGEFIDAGSIFYAVDIWNSCDLMIILIGAAFLLTRVIGLTKDSDRIIDMAFDILSLEALFMVPRICSLLSLHPYFGTIIISLKEMTKDFIKFMLIVLVLYLGFLTTFTLLARDSFTLGEMSWVLVKVFFGSSYLGFDIMYQISPQLGPPLMLVFVCLTNILLITSLISILSDSFSKINSRAREENLFLYSVYVLESSTSNRLTHFYPPFNLIPLILVRPLRLFMSSSTLRRTRIGLLKATHAPIVLAIKIFEGVHQHIQDPSSFPRTPIATVPSTPHSGAGGTNSFGTTSMSGEPAYKGKAKKKFLTSRTGTNHSLHFMDGPGIGDGEASPLVSGKWEGGLRGRKEGCSSDVGNCGRVNGKVNGKLHKKLTFGGEDSGLGGEDDDTARKVQRTEEEEERTSERERRLENKVDELGKRIEELTRLFMADKGLGGDDEM